MSRVPLLTETSYDAGKSAELRQNVAMCLDDEEDEDSTDASSSVSLSTSRAMNLNKMTRHMTLSFIEGSVGRREHDLSCVSSSSSRLTTGHTHASTPRLQNHAAKRSIKQNKLIHSRSFMWKAVRDGTGMDTGVPVTDCGSSSPESADGRIGAVQHVSDGHFDPRRADGTAGALSTELIQETQKESPLEGTDGGSNIVACEQVPREEIPDGPSLEDSSLHTQDSPTRLSVTAPNDGHRIPSHRSSDSIRALMFSRAGTVSRSQDDATRVSFEFSTIDWGVETMRRAQKQETTRAMHIMTQKDASITIMDEELEEEDDSDEDGDDPFDPTSNPSFDDISDTDPIEMLHLSSKFDYLDVSFVDQVFGKQSRSTSPVTDSTSPVTGSTSPVTDISAVDGSPKNAPADSSQKHAVKLSKRDSASTNIGSASQDLQPIDDGASFDFVAIDWVQPPRYLDGGNSFARPIVLRPKLQLYGEPRDTLNDSLIKPKKSQRPSPESRSLNDHPARSANRNKIEATRMSRRYSAISQLAPNRATSPLRNKNEDGSKAVAGKTIGRTDLSQISGAADGSEDLSMKATERSKNVTATPASSPRRRKGKSINQRECGEIAMAQTQLNVSKLKSIGDLTSRKKTAKLMKKTKAVTAKNVDAATTTKHSSAKKS